MISKIWNCWIKKDHKWIIKYKLHDIYGTEYQIIKCQICGKTKYEMGPFPPEHVNCRCTIKEGD